MSAPTWKGKKSKRAGSFTLESFIATSSNSFEVKVVNAVIKSGQTVFKGKSHDETPTSGLITQNPLRQKVNQSTIRWAFIRRPDVNS